MGDRMEMAPVRSRNRAPLLMGLALGAVALAAAGFYFMPHVGQIAVNVADSKGSAVPHLVISVDGKTQCESAPCIVLDVAAGPHTVKVEASGFEPPADKAVAVEWRKDTTVDFSLAPTANGGTGIKVAGTQAGAKLFGKATISLGTPGARVFLVSGSDRRELPTLPISVDIDTSKPWSLGASKPGFNDYNQPISFDDGQAEKAFIVTLDPKTATSAYNPQTPRAPSATSQAVSNEGAVATSGQAFLNINSIPVSSVTLDGKPIGSTPKLKYRVSPGAHSLVFVNPDQGFKKQISVTVAAGETKAATGKN
jgi:hypothetical protein